MKKIFFLILLAVPQWIIAQTPLYLPGSTSGIAPTVSGNGNVGIGTNTPQDALDVSGDIRVASRLRFGVANAAGGSYGVIGLVAGVPGKSIMFYNYDGPVNELMTLNGASGNAAIPNGGLTVSGNVGIGTNTIPLEKLSVNGNIDMPFLSSIGHLSSQDKFVYDNKNVGNYSLGWYHDSWITGAPSGYLSAFGGLKIFTGGNPRLVVANQGNVGINNPSPQSHLDVNGNANISDGLDVQGVVNLSGGRLSLLCNLAESNSAAFNNSSSSGYGFYSQGGRSNRYSFHFLNQAGNSILYGGGDGKIGIGTNQPDAMLTVKGDIHTKEVRIDVEGAMAPDYVFEKDYDLLPLSELETYINKNKHLPEVPSAKEMEAKGLNLKEMNLILLKKVEELTLHILQQERRIATLESKSRKK